MSEISDPHESFLAWERYNDPDFQRHPQEDEDDPYVHPADRWDDDE